MNWLNRMAIATVAFKEAYVTAGTFDNFPFESYEGRMLRYDSLWASYENTGYRDIHKWAHALRAEYGLYRYIRNIYNPAYRLTEFWKTAIWGGLLDPEAGEEGAIPIQTTNDNIRPALAQLWADSNWDISKDITVGWGSALGDVFIKVCDDPKNGKMRLENINPSSIKELTLDKNKYVKGYIIEEVRILDDKKVIYKEVAERIADGTQVKYSLFKDTKPFSWGQPKSTWTEDYVFVPLVAIQHNPVGGNFGWAEIHPLRSKASEADDIASKLHDYIRKTVDPIWLFNFAEPRKKIAITGSTPTVDNPQPGREEINAIYIPNAAAKAQALVSPDLDIEKVSKEIQGLLAEMERDFPELQMDIWTAGGYTTGKALKTARQRVEKKVIQRRPNYDRALERAHKMALSIGAQNGYEGYSDLPVDGYEKKLFDHKIPSDRPIFDTDSTTEIQDRQIFWNIITQSKDKNIPLEFVLKDLGWSDSKIKKFAEGLAAEEKKAADKAQKAAALVANTVPPNPADPNATPKQNPATPVPGGTSGQ